MVLEDQSEVRFSFPQGTLSQQPILSAVSSSSHTTEFLSFRRYSPNGAVAYERSGGVGRWTQAEVVYGSKWTHAGQANFALHLVKFVLLCITTFLNSEIAFH